MHQENLKGPQNIEFNLKIKKHLHFLIQRVTFRVMKKIDFVLFIAVVIIKIMFINTLNN